MVVIAAMVDVVVVGAGAHEQAEVTAKVEVGVADQAQAMGDQAAPVESVVAVVAVGIVAPAKGMGRLCRAPGQAIGDDVAVLHFEVVADFEDQGGQRGTEQEQGTGNCEQGGESVRRCCFFSLLPLNVCFCVEVP